MPTNKYKGVRNRKIVALHDKKGLSLRAIARQEKLSNSTVHKIYWCEKMRAGETKGIPKRTRTLYKYLIQSKADV